MATHSSILAWRIPMDRGAPWATVHGVAKSRHDLVTKQLLLISLPFPQVLVDTKDVQDTDVPEDDVHAVDHATIAHVRLLLEAKDGSDHEHGNGHEVCDVPILLQPNFYFLA